uniref:Polysaccharide pyruvyl transferase domain-containing protein n=1 Tax=Prevotella sp. GTC17262 TaxID=3236797 RepID=A0AB33JQU9_9BACT
MSRDNYALIGSILQSANKNTIVWGSGLLFVDSYPKEQPKKICAVRGPLSRKVLVEHGIACPEVYGDPILLLPKFYQPQVKQRYKIGIIPHIHDENNEILKQYQSVYPDSILISMKHYGKWQEIVDKIASCDLILSSSLHGLIVSDAYGVPNKWIEFNNQAEDKKFKFLDYFASVRRKTTRPTIITTVSDLDIVLGQRSEKEEVDIDLQPLIESCPFKLPFNI